MKQKKKIIIIAIFAVLVLSVLLVNRYINEQKAQDMYEELSDRNTETEEVAEDTIFTRLGIEDPGKIIDWDYLWEQNEDIYAWIYIPGTQIDYPVLQHKSDDSYYLDYNLDGSKGYPGCIYTERINAKEFTDYNTVVYGHNMKDGTMFAGLHLFEEEAFFEDNRYIFIYTPEQLYIYDIFGAYKFTNAHILYAYDCSTQTGYDIYLDMVFEKYIDKGHFRDGVEVTSDDHIITLATCVSGESDKRYLVQGVLVEYEGFELEQVEDTETEEQAE